MPCFKCAFYNQHTNTYIKPKRKPYFLHVSWSHHYSDCETQNTHSQCDTTPFTCVKLNLQQCWIGLKVACKGKSSPNDCPCPIEKCVLGPRFLVVYFFRLRSNLNQYFHSLPWPTVCTPSRWVELKVRVNFLLMHLISPCDDKILFQLYSNNLQTSRARQLATQSVPFNVKGGPMFFSCPKL